MRIRLLLLMGLLVLSTAAMAHDSHGPVLSDDYWHSLQAEDHSPCCGNPHEDATELGDAQVVAKGDHYEVEISGQWVRVPNEKIVHKPNLAGHALVWPYWINGQPYIRCFMPGALL